MEGEKKKLLCFSFLFYKVNDVLPMRCFGLKKGVCVCVSHSFVCFAVGLSFLRLPGEHFGCITFCYRDTETYSQLFGE